MRYLSKWLRDRRGASVPNWAGVRKARLVVRGGRMTSDDASRTWFLRFMGKPRRKTTPNWVVIARRRASLLTNSRDASTEVWGFAQGGLARCGYRHVFPTGSKRSKRRPNSLRRNVSVGDCVTNSSQIACAAPRNLISRFPRSYAALI
jgi:hypothetical protein